MPELPEVETVRAGLAPALTGATIKSIQIHDARSLKRHPGSVENFVFMLTDAKILGVSRRGKFLWLPLNLAAGKAKPDEQLALVGHLGMSGQMLLREPAAEPDKLTRVSFLAEQADGSLIEFRFVDQRIFGSLAIDELVSVSDNAEAGFSAGVGVGQWWQNQIPKSAAHISRDPLDAAFDQSAVIAKFAKKNSGIKRVLLDQGTLSGIGNIYADEALWLSKLHYDQPASSLSKSKANELIENVKVILAKAVAEGGTSFDEQYKNVNGESGYFAVSLNAYGMTGMPCKRCGAPIVREAWMNRGSHFCPRCQRLKA
jgi:formamidopyrimidine-DNA glycosylase